jgi:hypothetical protein
MYGVGRRKKKSFYLYRHYPVGGRSRISMTFNDLLIAICRALFPTTLLLAALIRQNCISFVYFFLFILYFWIHNVIVAKWTLNESYMWTVIIVATVSISAQIIYQICLAFDAAPPDDLVLQQFGLMQFTTPLMGLQTVGPDAFECVFSILYLWFYRKCEKDFAAKRGRKYFQLTITHSTIPVFALLLVTSITNPSFLHFPYLVLVTVFIFGHSTYSDSLKAIEDRVLGYARTYLALHLLLLYTPALISTYSPTTWSKMFGFSDWTNPHNVLVISYLTQIIAYVCLCIRDHTLELEHRKGSATVDRTALSAAEEKFLSSMKKSNLAPTDQLSIANQLHENRESLSRKFAGSLFRAFGSTLCGSTLLVDRVV